MNNKYMKHLILFLILAPILFSCQKQVNHRKESSLNGTWKITKTGLGKEIPSTFDTDISVPGFVDMIKPNDHDSVFDNSIYWYKRSFTVEDLQADVIQLKINKACYHTRVYVNGKKAGENVYNFTPSVFNIKPYLNIDKKENELIIAVGCRNNLPDSVTNGGDFEKSRYIPGIYDDVKITTSGYPFISNVQTAPDIKKIQLQVVVEIRTNKTSGNSSIDYVVRESVSKKVIAEGTIDPKIDHQSDLSKVEFTIKMDGCQLWTPENPFLYDLEIRTTGDNTTTRFGMRSFAANPENGAFLLNDKPYYLRGTNVCFFRFIEDYDRKGLPWESKWAVKLHDRFKEMQWNSIRYCIGFPPERWYEIADSTGFLIQDEYPIWTGTKGGFEKLLKGVSSRSLASEYREWMRERWNHPCVVVWDGQNESVNDTTAKAIQLVRSLDLSNRPWDNGWAAPASHQDVIESHPYLFSQYMNKKPGKGGYLKEMLQENRDPRNDPNEHTPLPNGKVYTNSVIINEYSWLWLNRDGSTTTVTDKVYANVFPEADTPAKRFEACAKNTAILTEYWRAHRKAGAVMHFNGLGYSRPETPRGATSDNFIDLKNLEYEPYFYKYVKPAFSPVAVMADFWENSMKKGQKMTIPVILINDTYDKVADTLRLNILTNNQKTFSQSVAYVLENLQKKVIEIPVTIPEKTGQSRLEAEIVYKGESVKSIREFKIE
jgi:beta-galactosidase